AAAQLVAQAARHQQLAELAGLREVQELGPAAARPALGAVLDDPAELAGGLDGNAALVDVVAARLLDVDVFGRLAGPDGHEGVQVVRRGNRDGVEVLVVQRLAHVLDGLRLGAALGGRAEALAEGPRVGVDQVGDLHAGHAGEGADVRAAAA